MQRHVFVTGGTGYLGRPLIEHLAARGHHVRALVREGSTAKLPGVAEPVIGNALDATGWTSSVAPADTLVHLVGTPHPSPFKGAAFRAVDLPSIRASVAAAVGAKVSHFVYVSVAHPAPIMRDYIAVRTEGEALIAAQGLNVTILRPWYVLGPGHWWPYALVPFYAVARRIPSLRDDAMRLDLVTHEQMLTALVAAVENPAIGVRVVGVDEISSTPNLQLSTHKAPGSKNRSEIAASDRD
ncbi:MAG: SDR family oxidoreductase [Vicinamibacterales bacterium]